ncbi:hypothetical protein JCM11491_001389 [Sporobolomyces phaffii]
MPPKSNSYNHAARKRTSTLPAALRTELEELGRIAPLPTKAGKLGRKDRRKDKRNETKQNRAKNQQKRSRTDDDEDVPPPPKKKAKDSAPPPEPKKDKKSVKFAGLAPESSPPPAPAPSKKQTPLEKLLAKQEGKAGGGVDVVAKKGGRKNMTDEDKEIAWLEAKLGLSGPPGQMTKKDKGKWKEEFAEDGLDELFEGMDDLEAAAFGDSNEKDYAKLLRESGDFSDLELDLDEEEGGDDSSADEFSGIQMDEDDDDAAGAFGLESQSGDSGEEDLDGFSDLEEGEDEAEGEEEDDETGSSDEDEEGDSDDFESEFDGSELSFHEGDEEDESGAMTMTFGDDEPSNQVSAAPPSASTSSAATTGRYVPPHLRNKETPPTPAASSNDAKSALTKPSDSLEAPPDDPRLRRLLNGHLNKLSPQNISTINDSLLSLYASHPRAIVSSILTQLLLGIVSDRDNLGDQLMITYACLVAALFRGIGVEFPAGVLTQAITLLDRSLAKADAATAADVKADEGGFEGKPGSKQAQNLVAFLSELYNFGVIGCGVVYDLVRLFIERGAKGLGELEVELLSKVVKRSGQQLRGDDPSALKDIITMVKQKMVGVDPSSMNSRTKFMIEQLTNLKNNKLPKLGADGAIDNYSGLKKYLVSLNKKRASGAAPDALRVSLAEIRSSSTRGKWWLVGAAWSGDPLLEAQQNGGALSEQVRTKESKSDAKLVKLARSQGMNTEVRKGVFNVLMSSEDFVDACERLLQLGLSDVQQREIARVLLQCSGNEKTYNPYYTLVAQRLCQKSHSFQITLQYLLWDFLRDLGEKSVGGEELVKNMQDDSANATHKVPDRKVHNLAKLYAWCVAKESLGISILKPVPFATAIPQTQSFLSTFFTHVFLSTQTASPAFVLPVKTSRRDREAVERVFVKAAANGSLLKGLGYYLEAHGEELVDKARRKLGDAEQKTVKFGLKLAAETLSVGGIVDV